jgi:hypothetical protein
MVAGAVVAIVIVGVAAFFVQRAVFSGGEDAGPAPQRYGEATLIGVPPDDLPGFRFSAPPSNYKPKISSREAFSIARDRRHMDARQILLASVESDVSNKTSSQVYIVNFEPDRISPHCSGAHVLYSISLVDADTARIVGGQTVESPAPRGCYPGLNSSPPTPAATAVP